MKQSLRNNVYVIVTILVLTGFFSFAMIEGGFVSWFLFYSFFVVALYMLGAYLYPIQRWKVTRLITEQSYEAGDTVDVEIHLKRNIPFPIFYAFCEEELNPSLQRKDRSNEKFHELSRYQTIDEKISFVSLVPILFKRTMILKYSIPHVPRGAHELHTLTIQTSDLFGCIKKEAVFHHVNDIHVYPRVRPATFISDTTAFQQDDGSQTSVVKGIQSILSTGVREYEAGDRIAWIDWKQTAKTNEMMTKEFEREKDTSVLFVFDHHAYEDMNMLAFEGAIETAVALLHDTQGKATHTALASIGAEVAYMDLERAALTEGHVAEHFMRVVPEQGTSFAKQLEEFSMHIQRQNVTCVISTRITNDMVEALEKAHLTLGEMMFVCILSKNDQTMDVTQRFEQLQLQGITVCVLSEDELVQDPIEVVGYGKN